MGASNLLVAVTIVEFKIRLFIESQRAITKKKTFGHDGVA